MSSVEHLRPWVAYDIEALVQEQGSEKRWTVFGHFEARSFAGKAAAEVAFLEACTEYSDDPPVQPEHPDARDLIVGWVPGAPPDYWVRDLVRANDP